jgi:hypothetical protein
MYTQGVPIDDLPAQHGYFLQMVCINNLIWKYENHKFIIIPNGMRARKKNVSI